MTGIFVCPANIIGEVHHAVAIKSNAFCHAARRQTRGRPAFKHFSSCAVKFGNVSLPGTNPDGTVFIDIQT